MLMIRSLAALFALAAVACSGKGFDGDRLAERAPAPSATSADEGALAAAPASAKEKEAPPSALPSTPSGADAGPAAPVSVSFASGLDEKAVTSTETTLAEDQTIRVSARVVVSAIAPATAQCNVSVLLVGGTTVYDRTFPETKAVGTAPTEILLSDTVEGDHAGTYRVVLGLVCYADLVGAIGAQIKVLESNVAVLPPQ